jgi:hypothetical protein
MGNRALVVFAGKDMTTCSPAAYLHWNGGPESVYAFLAEMDRRHIRCDDPSYECARFIQLVGEYFDVEAIGTLSLGVRNGPELLNGEVSNLWLAENWVGDNGLYLVRRQFIGVPYVQRYNDYGRMMTDEEAVKEMLTARNHNYNAQEASIAVSLLQVQHGRPIVGERDDSSKPCSNDFPAWWENLLDKTSSTATEKSEAAA